jgi:DNA-binding response OmpR family regulator
LLACPALPYTQLTYIYIECHEFSVEDETDLMQLYLDALSGAGHEVDGFIDSVDAYPRFQENSDRYDAVICDVRMEGMSGVQLAKKLKVNKDVQISLMSAFEFNEDHYRI